MHIHIIVKYFVSFLIVFFSFLTIFTGCQKVKDQVQQAVGEDLIVTIMTSGRWVVELFNVAGADVKPEFDGQEFQFLKDGAVEAIKGTTTVKGTWKSDKTALTIQANFPPGNNSLERLNYTWNITKSGLTFVEASTLLNGAVSSMRLNKK